MFLRRLPAVLCVAALPALLAVAAVPPVPAPPVSAEAAASSGSVTPRAERDALTGARPATVRSGPRRLHQPPTPNAAILISPTALVPAGWRPVDIPALAAPPPDPLLPASGRGPPPRAA